MKRFGYLWPEVVDFANLWQASRKAQRGKRFRENVLRFNYNLEGELLQLQEELLHKTYQPGPYHTFEVKEPKPRMISAAPYRDRVVHHALCNVIVPIFERTFVAESFANRFGFGTHRALRRFVQLSRSHSYVLQCDVRKYFPSIDHEILKTLIRRKIKCPDTLWLIDRIIDASNPQELMVLHFPGDDLLAPLERRRGLPIGNLTSQFFANVYLNGFDHYVKEVLAISPYVRYVDDFALFANDKKPFWLKPKQPSKPIWRGCGSRFIPSRAKFLRLDMAPAFWVFGFCLSRFESAMKISAGDDAGSIGWNGAMLRVRLASVNYSNPCKAGRPISNMGILGDSGNGYSVRSN